MIVLEEGCMRTDPLLAEAQASVMEVTACDNWRDNDPADICLRLKSEAAEAPTTMN
jgi:hypothetical protein